LLACRATLKGHRENTTHASLIQIGRGLQESLSRVLSVWREVRRRPIACLTRFRYSLRPTRKKSPARVLDSTAGQSALGLGGKN
jgi:hypothetical protein